MNPLNDANSPQFSTLSAFTAGKNVTVYVDTFTTVGANTWTKRAGFLFGYRIGIGGGGGAGSGRKGAAGTARGGGQAGGPGCVMESWFTSSDVGATETVTVGDGGTGGASVTANSTDGNPGTNGGNTTMTGTGATFTCYGGLGGFGGVVGSTNNIGSGPSIYPTSFTSLVLGSASNYSLPTSISYCGVGANGLQIPATNTIPAITTSISYNPPRPANSAGFGFGFSGINAGGIIGTVDGQSGTNGTDSPVVGIYGGGGGGGGYASLLTNAGNGGNGGKYGASGGGGGASVNSVGNSGAGGNGAQGIMVVISYVQS